MPRPRKKRQTRLTFSPLSSSSPAASQYPDQIRERAAAVRYDNHGRAAKKIRLNGTSSGQARLISSFTSSSPKVVIESPPKEASKSKEPFIFSKIALPTPAASSQAEDLGPRESSVAMDLQSPRLSSRPRHNGVTAHPASSSEDDDVITAPVPKRLFSHGANAKTTGSDVFSDFSSPILKENAKTVSGSPHMITAARPTRFGSNGDIDSESSLGADERVVISSSDDESDQIEERAKFLLKSRNLSNTETPPQNAPSPTRHGRPRRLVSGRSSDSSMDPNLLKRKQSTISPTKTTNSALKSSAQMPSKRINLDKLGLTMTRISPVPLPKHQPRQGKNGSAEDGRDSTSDSDEILTPARRRRPTNPSKAQLGDEDSDEIRSPTSSSRKRLIQRKPSIVSVSDQRGSSSDDLVVSPVRKRRLRNAPEPSIASNPNIDGELLEDLQEDLEDLKQTELRDSRTRGTQRTPKKTKAQERLELIRRQRAGGSIDEDNDAPDEGETATRSRRALYDTTDDSDNSDELQASEEEVYNQPIETGENLDEYDEDFVVEDQDDTIGAPTGISDMPFEFTRHAHKKPIEHFKDAVEWMVHNKLNPAFPRDDTCYQVAFFKLDDQVQGLAGSKFVSAAWGGDFLKALKSRPEVAYVEVSGLFNLEHCAACNKSNHPAKFQLIFSGKRYDRHTLEEESDTSDQDEEGAEQQETFYVGRTCCANAETAHALHHWRHALNYWVLKCLKEQGHTTAEKILQRERWSTKRKTEYANSVVDGMETNGQLRQLYKEFKENLQAARDVRNDRYDYGRKMTR
ncbi:MAG: hypothetical protein Q9195_003489 [Heterodermia aff. obscurata]